MNYKVIDKETYYRQGVFGKVFEKDRDEVLFELPIYLDEGAEFQRGLSDGVSLGNG